MAPLRGMGVYCEIVRSLKIPGKVDFHFTAPIAREDFITERQYLSFKKRAECLGLKVE